VCPRGRAAQELPCECLIHDSLSRARLYGRRWATRALALAKADEWKAQYLRDGESSSRSRSDIQAESCRVR
jgi:hypothetical protein